MAGLRSALETLFSSNVVVHNVGGDDIKVVDTSNIQSISRDHMGSGHQMRSGAGRGAGGGVVGMSGIGTGPGAYADSLQRRRLYQDYERMDNAALISSALAFYAD